MFATHFHELTALAAKLPRLHNATMRVKEWQGDVVFLHEVMPGAAEGSYGIQVAKLAGIPQSVIDRAKVVLAELESEERKTPLKGFDDLPLFQVATAPAPDKRETPVDKVISALEALHPDEMSPREAMDALYALKVRTRRDQEALKVPAAAEALSQITHLQAMPIVSPADMTPDADALGEVVNSQKSERETEQRRGDMRRATAGGCRSADARNCRNEKKLPIATGNTANTPDANEPMLWLRDVTTITQSATIAARHAISARVACTFVFTPSMRKGRLAMMAAPITIALRASALAGVQLTSRASPRRETPRQRRRRC